MRNLRNKAKNIQNKFKIEFNNLIFIINYCIKNLKL